MIKQTALRRLRIETNGVPWKVSFVFPFFDAALRVAFVMVIADTGHFAFRDRLRLVRRGLLVGLGYTPRPLLALREAEPELFHQLFHFDPWWTMRVAAGVPPAVRNAVMATNVAARRQGHLVIRDVLFDEDLEQVEELWVGDGVFRTVPYNRIRPMPHDLHQTFLGPIA